MEGKGEEREIPEEGEGGERLFLQKTIRRD